MSRPRIGSANVNSLLRFSRSAVGRRAMLVAWVASQLATPTLAAEPASSPGLLTPGQQSVEAPPEARESEDEPTTRLNLFNRTWRDILEKVADDTGSTLVIQDLPPGRFSRADFHAYTRSEAVAILNRELAPRDYRILENGEYLIVMSARTMRKHYRPSVSSSEPARREQVVPVGAEAPAEEEEFVGYQRDFETIVPAGGVQAAGGQAGSGEAPGAWRATADAAHPIEQRDEKKSAENSTPVTLTVQLREQAATAVAKRLHEAFGRQSELIDAGASGLPAFRVVSDPQSEALSRPVSFEVEIDTRENELLVTAPRERATVVAKLLRDVDAASDPGQVLRVAPAGPKQQWLATQLQPVLAQVDGDNGRGGDSDGGGDGDGRRGGDDGRDGRDGRDRGDDDDGDRDRGRDGDRDGGQEAVVGGDLPALIGNLRGEVTIESVPDLDVLILRGNDQDVQAVLQVIQTLEQLSAGQQPVIELLRLEHVNSAALATLLEEVYGRLATVRNKGTESPSQVAAVPIVKPNSVLLIAPEGEMPAVLDLAAELDRPVEPATEFEVFRLKSALASETAETVTDFYEEREGLGTRVTVVPHIRTNSLIVSAQPRDLEEIASLISDIDKNESGLVNQIQIYPLQSASADELADVINQAIQSVLNPTAAQQGEDGGFNFAGGAGGEAAEQLTAARSAVLEFLDATGDVPELKKSGLLADIRVTPDPRTNSLIVTAGEQSLPLIESLIRQLDRPASATAVIKVFSLENSDAASVVELLNNLFGVSEDGGDDDGTPGIQLAGANDPGSSLIPLRFAMDPRTNSVIASGSGDAMTIVEAILTRLDESDIRQRETTVVKLKNAPAIYVAEAIQQFLTSQRELILIDDDLVSNIELLEREIIVVPEPVSNSLLVSATPRYYEEVREIIAKLDEAPPQVIIQAMLVEVALDNTDEFGIELGFQDSTLFDRSLTTIDEIIETTQTAPNGVQTTTQQIITQSGEPGFLFNNTGPLGNNTATGPGSIGTQGLSNFSLGRANSELGYGGFVFSASSANVSVLLRALSARRTVQVLSRPQIRTLDNQPAIIQVGQSVPRVEGVNIGTTGQASPIVNYDDAGLILNVIPRISPDGNIVMEVQATRSEYTGAGVPIFVDSDTGNTVEAPIKDITTASATVSVPTGQTIVLGGIISRSDDTIERKVPYLGDVPYLGTLFRYDSTTMRRRELLVFLTPRVIYNDADNELIKQVEADRLHFIEHEAEAIHGPLYGVPPAGTVPGVPPVLETNAYPGPGPAIPNGAEILPGLPAEACPPGTYPPGTLFDGQIPGPASPPMPGPTPTPGPAPGPGPSPMPSEAGPPAFGPQGQASPSGDFETVRTTGEPVMSGRLKGTREE